MSEDDFSSESDFMRHLQRRASELGARLFRQQTGMGWVGNPKTTKRIYKKEEITVFPGDVVIRKARPFHTGFPGWSDLGGWAPVVITPEMVGSTIAQYTQAEIKLDTRPTTEQLTWIAAVNGAGGRAAIVRSEDDLTKLLFGTR